MGWPRLRRPSTSFCCTDSLRALASNFVDRNVTQRELTPTILPPLLLRKTRTASVYPAHTHVKLVYTKMMKARRG